MATVVATVGGWCALGAIGAEPPEPSRLSTRGRVVNLPRNVNPQYSADASVRLAQAPATPPTVQRVGPPPGPANGPVQREVGPPRGFDDDQFRLPLLNDSTNGLGTIPRPTPQKQQEYNQFIERTIDPENTLELILRRPRLLVFKQAPVRVQVADDAIANYDLITDREFSIVGNEIGATILNFWFPDPANPQKEIILSYLVRVLPSPEEKARLEVVYAELEKEINRDFPNSAVQLSLVGDSLVLRGEARDIVESQQILQVVFLNAPRTRQTLRSRREQDLIQGALGQQGLSQSATDPAITVVGGAADLAQANATNAQNLLGNQANLANAQVINLLRVPGEHQVMLRVTVAEINRNAARSIGLNMTFTNGNGVNVFQSLAGAATIGAGNLPTFLDNGQVNLAIRALRNLSLARSLAEPNLVTSNGQPASFLAGGEFPVPSGVAAFGAAAQGVAFVPFGVQLQFIPYITDRDRIRLTVRATVSTRDASLGATISGTTVSGLNSRTFISTVELRDGQTLAVGGLIQNNFAAQSERVPLWGDLPIIGTLGGVRSTQSAEQELVILITPELVHPLEACQTPPVPGADIFEPGDVEFYLEGRLESRRSQDFRASARTDWARMRRYEHCEDKFIIGVQGRTYGCCDTHVKGCPTPASTEEALPHAQPGQGPVQAPMFPAPPAEPLPAFPPVAPTAYQAPATNPLSTARAWPAQVTPLPPSQSTERIRR